MDLVTSRPRMVPGARAAGAPTEPKEKDLASRPCRGSQLVAGMWELLMEGSRYKQLTTKLSRIFTTSAKNSSGPPRANHDAEFLQEGAEKLARGTARAGRGCMGHVFENFGGSRIPGTRGLHHHRHERSALSVAFGPGLEMLFFVHRICCRSGPRGVSSQGESFLSLWRCDGEVECNRPSGHGWDVDIGGTSTRHCGVVRALRQQNPGRFFFRPQPSTFRPLENGIPHCVVALCPFPPAAHMAAWWLMASRTASHLGHHLSIDASGIASRARSSVRKAGPSMWQAPEGMATRKARAPISASDRRVACSTKLLRASWEFQDAMSRCRERSRCFRAKAVSTLRASVAGMLVLKAATAW